MIDAYRIKIVDGEERLFIYLNYNYEFASFNFNKSRDSLTKIIKDYIKRNNIIYKGTLVSLICGGMILGTVNLKNINNDYNSKYVVNNEIVLEIPKIEIPKKEEKINIKKNDNDIIINNKQNNNIIKKDTNKEKQNYSIVKEQDKIENNIYVEVKRSNGTVKLELEEYLIGVVGSEMPASFHIEALKSQAVVARTYTLNIISKGKPLTDNISTQVYKDNNELKNMWKENFDTYYKKVKKAVDETKGEILTYNGNYIDAVYHSTSNGKTENAKNVWGNSIPYLVSVDSPFDKSNPNFEKTIEVSYEDFSKIMKLEFNSDTTIKLNGVTEGKRVSYVQIGENVFSGVEFRNILGLRSADFDIEKKDNSLFITTYGYGHGVGMSQYGANGMAKNGSNYKEILKHYYKGVTLSKK